MRKVALRYSYKKWATTKRDISKGLIFGIKKMIYKKSDKKSVISSFGNKNKRWIENSVTHAENRIIEFLNWVRL